VEELSPLELSKIPQRWEGNAVEEQVG